MRHLLSQEMLGSLMENSQARRASFGKVSSPKNTFRFAPHSVPRTLVATAIAGILSAAAQAQQAPTTATADANVPEMQEVVVTGTMIKRVDAETAEAVTILKADALKDQGITNLEQVMNTLTSANPSVNVAQAVGTFSGGGTYADLRGLGRSRTLILLDGQRVAVNAFDGAGVDLSGIPISAIDTIEVLKEGAS